MNIKHLIAAAALFAACLATDAKVKVSIHEKAENQPVIPAEIYGQFAEHLGRCIYDGIWVGKDSPVPNVNGYRKDLLDALRVLKVPVLRWPGGCFADEYHWRDGIGPQESRPGIVNSNWGGTTEDNSFGTHEFMNLCEMLGIEPYISGNVGSGTVEELAKWIEYMTAASGPMAELRKANGRTEPWKLKYVGIGNESWGCGGCMRPEYYADLYRRYQTYCRNYNGNVLYKVASGASDYDYNWTRVLMQNARGNMDGLSLHYYSTMNWESKGSATSFSDDDYYNLLGKAVEIDEVLRKHEAIMDEFDPKGEVDLLLDEWGTWWEVEPGTNPGHLYQQNTMRDAIMAALSLNIFNAHTGRLKMANIAQMVNVLQAMILTNGAEIVLTPTYHVFRMYNVHQNARFVPSEVGAAFKTAPDGRSYPSVSASVSRSESGVYNISLANTDLAKAQTVELEFDGFAPGAVSGEILTSGDIRDYNDFGADACKVAPVAFSGIKKNGRKLTVELPAASVVVLSVN